MRVKSGAVLAALMGVLAAPGLGLADDNIPPGVKGFPPGYFLPCAAAPATAVLTVPKPFDAFMRVLCTKAGHTLAPPPGTHWVFSNGESAWLSSLSTHSGLTGQAAHFTRLENAPLTADEAAAFKDRLKPVITNTAMLEGDVLRLVVDTSTGDHKQIYLLVTHDGAGAVTGLWGVECFNDCKPMEDPPWAFKAYPDKP